MSHCGWRKWQSICMPFTFSYILHHRLPSLRKDLWETRTRQQRGRNRLSRSLPTSTKSTVSNKAATPVQNEPASRYLKDLGWLGLGHFWPPSPPANTCILIHSYDSTNSYATSVGERWGNFRIYTMFFVHPRTRCFSYIHIRTNFSLLAMSNESGR